VLRCGGVAVPDLEVGEVFTIVWYC
jgi:hypothetical protein